MAIGNMSTKTEILSKAEMAIGNMLMKTEILSKVEMVIGNMLTKTEVYQEMIKTLKKKWIHKVYLTHLRINKKANDLKIYLQIDRY